MTRTTSGHFQNGHSSGTNGSTNSSSIWSQAKWSTENDQFISDFVNNQDLPHLALVTKGQYLSVGAPNVASPALQPYVFVYAKRTSRKLTGRLMKLKDGRANVLTNQKVAVSEHFSGYFEILSEDGRPMKCIESVQELIQKFPDVCVVRQGCRAHLPDGDGELRSLYRTRTLREGEVLTLVGQFHLKRLTFLRCFDETGKSVYLKNDCPKGRFSPLAKSKEAVSGAHTAQNLLTKRLPLTVRLISGMVNSELTSFSGSGHLVIRLQSIISEDHVFLCSLRKSGDKNQLMAIPLNAHLKLAPVLNRGQLMKHHEFTDLCDYCQQMMQQVNDRITTFYDEMTSSQNDVINCANISQSSTSDSNNNGAYEHSITDDEIDQLYDYVRGFGPLPTATTHHYPNDLESKKIGQRQTSDPDGHPKKVGHRRRSRSKSNNTYPENDDHPKELTAAEMVNLQIRRVSSPAIGQQQQQEAVKSNLQERQIVAKSKSPMVVTSGQEKSHVAKAYINKRLSKSNDKLDDHHFEQVANGHSVVPPISKLSKLGYENHVTNAYKRLSKSNDRLHDQTRVNDHLVNKIEVNGHSDNPSQPMAKHYYQQKKDYAGQRPNNYKIRPVATQVTNQVMHAPSTGALNFIGSSPSHVTNQQQHRRQMGGVTDQLTNHHYRPLRPNRAYKSLNNLATCDGGYETTNFEQSAVFDSRHDSSNQWMIGKAVFSTNQNSGATGYYHNHMTQQQSQLQPGHFNYGSRFAYYPANDYQF